MTNLIESTNFATLVFLWTVIILSTIRIMDYEKNGWFDRIYYGVLLILSIYAIGHIS